MSSARAAGLIRWAPCLAAALLLVMGCTSRAQQIDRIGVADLQSQRLSGAEAVAVAGSYGSPMTVVVTIDVDGKVIDARPGRNHFKLDPAPALEAARRWTFRPQIFDGHPVQAVGTISIEYQPPEIPADTSIPFPEVAPDDVEIVLARSACFGQCPAYRVAIRGDGLVRFSTDEENFPGTDAQVHRQFNGINILWPGTHEARVDPAAVAALLDRFRQANFLGLKSEYYASVTDNPTYALTLRLGKTSKHVIDYVGRDAGMPAIVTDLERAVDALARTDRWVRGTGETVDMLRARNIHIGSQAAADMVQAALILSGWPPDKDGKTSAFLRAMIAQGLDLDRTVETMQPGERRRIGVLIAQYAAGSGDAELFADLAQRGITGHMLRKDMNEAFTGDMGCNPAIARALVAAGADPKAQGEDGNALHTVRESYGACARASMAKRLDMARTLIALGVPLEARDSLGWTPLMGCNVPELAQLLLAAGADANARDKEGTTPLLSTGDDRVAILLLRAGADPHAKDSDGTVRTQVMRQPRPATIAWLDAHGIK